MYQFLTNEQKFLPSNIYELISTNATIAKFKQSTEELAQKTNPDDIVIITFNGHGGDGRFCFNDGYGNNQKSNINMLYKEIDNCLDGIKSYVTVITVSACYSKTALEPLKEGTFPRVVITMDNCWFSSISKNYLNPAMAHLPKQYYYIKPEDYDINGNEYVSIKESWDTRHKCQQRYFSQHPEQENKDGLMDISNISSDLYLGDFSLYYSFIDVPESSYNPCPDRLFFLYDRYAITSPNGYVIPIEIRNYGSNSSIIDPSDILYNHKKANEYGAFAPETNYNNPITLGAFGNPEECIVIEITLKTGTDSPWHPEQDVSIHISDIVFLIGLPEI